MASARAVWGIDVGKCALKALKLQDVDGELHVEAFDVIEHPKILSQPDADRDQLIRNALEQFLARNGVRGSRVIIAAPGQSGFTRFVKLPPVEIKQVPEIVRFEAEQQIPFNINEVIWRWQSFQDPDSPDIEVGIFAMKRTDVADALDRFNEVEITVDTVQMAPLALYNFLEFDAQASPEGATLLVDIGADKTDLVVSDGPRIWTRTLQLGGNNFTEALVKAFKLGFNKAEKLKRTAATSKYARQIFQAMRPVFAELVQEIQRSIGYYTSLHRESRFRRVVGLGNGFRLPGLQKFLEQNLNVPVVRVDSFNKLSPSPAVNAPAFTENVPSFAVAYGLALQGLGLTKIQINLLPGEILRQRRWARKRPWFAAGAAMFLVAGGLWAYMAKVEAARLEPSLSAELPQVRRIVSVNDQWRRQYDQVKGQDKQEEARLQQYVQMEGYHYVWPTLHFIASKAINRVAGDQDKLEYDEQALQKLKERPRQERQMVFLESLYWQPQPGVTDLKDLETLIRSSCRGGIGAMGRDNPYEGAVAAPSKTGAPAGAAAKGAAPTTTRPGTVYVLYLTGSTPFREKTDAGERLDVVSFLTSIKNSFLEVSREFADVIDVPAGLVVDIKEGAKAAALGVGAMDIKAGQPGTIGLDPLTGEPTNEDTSFVLGWVIVLKGDGIPPLPPAQVGAAGGVK